MLTLSTWNAPYWILSLFVSLCIESRCSYICMYVCLLSSFRREFIVAVSCHLDINRYCHVFVCFYLKYSQIMSKTQVVFNPSTKIWSGPSVTYPYGNKSVGEVIYETLLSDLDHVSQVTIVSNQCYCPHFKITHF